MDNLAGKGLGAGLVGTILWQSMSKGAKKRVREVLDALVDGLARSAYEEQLRRQNASAVDALNSNPGPSVIGGTTPDNVPFSTTTQDQPVLARPSKGDRNPVLEAILGVDSRWRSTVESQEVV